MKKGDGQKLNKVGYTGIIKELTDFLVRDRGATIDNSFKYICTYFLYSLFSYVSDYLGLQTNQTESNLPRFEFEFEINSNQIQFEIEMISNLADRFEFGSI